MHQLCVPLLLLLQLTLLLALSGRLLLLVLPSLCPLKLLPLLLHTRLQ
jgi:hypothetical protein